MMDAVQDSEQLTWECRCLLRRMPASLWSPLAPAQSPHSQCIPGDQELVLALRWLGQM